MFFLNYSIKHITYTWHRRQIACGLPGLSSGKSPLIRLSVIACRRTKNSGARAIDGWCVRIRLIPICMRCAHACSHAKNDQHSQAGIVTVTQTIQCKNKPSHIRIETRLRAPVIIKRRTARRSFIHKLRAPVRPYRLHIITYAERRTSKPLRKRPFNLSNLSYYGAVHSFFGYMPCLYAIQ